MPKKNSNKSASKRRTVKRNKSVKNEVKKSNNPWTDHLRMCTVKYNITYKQAITDAKCRNLYYLKREEA